MGFNHALLPSWFYSSELQSNGLVTESCRFETHLSHWFFSVARFFHCCNISFFFIFLVRPPLTNRPSTGSSNFFLFHFLVGVSKSINILLITVQSYVAAKQFFTFQPKVPLVRVRHDGRNAHTLDGHPSVLSNVRLTYA